MKKTALMYCVLASFVGSSAHAQSVHDLKIGRSVGIGIGVLILDALKESGHSCHEVMTDDFRIKAPIYVRKGGGAHDDGGFDSRVTGLMTCALAVSELVKIGLESGEVGLATASSGFIWRRFFQKNSLWQQEQFIRMCFLVRKLLVTLNSNRHLGSPTLPLIRV